MHNSIQHLAWNVMNKEDLIKHLSGKVFVRLKPSIIVPGCVGVFAIRKIPANTDPFGEDSITSESFPVEEIRNHPQIPDSVKRYVEDMGVISNGLLYIPGCGMNFIGVGYYVNHSESPNMKTDDGGERFLTLRVIEEGEELTINYSTYNDETGIR